jgi:hypothetical protein
MHELKRMSSSLNLSPKTFLSRLEEAEVPNFGFWLLRHENSASLS